MELFKNGLQSHAHSLEFLELIMQYESFLDSVTTVADFGCGLGYDMQWWDTLEYLETYEDAAGSEIENWKARNLRCFAVDVNSKQIEVELSDRVSVIEGDFERRVLPVNVDVIWCHNALHYATNPLDTLKIWNEQLNENGMLCIAMPLQNSYLNNRLTVRGIDRAYFNHNFLSLTYMLAVNGFDCRDAYFLKKENDFWLNAAVYKSHHAPMDPKKTSWWDLAELGLVNDSIKNSIDKNGFVRQEDVIYKWLDGNWHYIRD